MEQACTCVRYGYSVYNPSNQITVYYVYASQLENPLCTPVLGDLCIVVIF